MISFRKLFGFLTKESNKEEDIISFEMKPKYIKGYFDGKYKIILDRELLPDHVEMIHWINENSIAGVAIRIYSAYKMEKGWVLSSVGKNRVFIAFEDLDDALVFKIKYSV
jgi:hypothetical protein